MHDADPRQALVIDDEALVSVLIEELLRDLGYEVTVVNSRAQLEGALGHGRYDLAVSDTDLASFEDMQTWKVDRIVLCSGKPRDYLAAAFPKMRYVTKPFTELDLREAITEGGSGPGKEKVTTTPT
jgi:CheY-like chemotaxis protein